MLQPKVISVLPLDNYELLIEYETGERKKFDVKPYIKGNWYSELKEKKNLNTIHPGGRKEKWVDG